MANTDKHAGKAKEAAGRLTGNDETQDEGRTPRFEDESEERVDDAKDATRGAFESTKERPSDDKRGVGER